MKRSTIGWLVAAVLAVGGGAFFYLFWFAGGSGEPSTELTTPELADTTTTSAAESESGSDTTSAETTTTEATDGAVVTFVIDPAQSSARFELDEVLRGQDTHVVGTTDQIAGQVRVDTTDLSTAEFSDLVVNARTFTTGSDQRDRAIRGPVILDSGSDDHELITFTVTGVDGLAGEAAPGETVEFTIAGDMTIKGTTAPVTFDAQVTWVDETTIEGSAVTEVTRDMFEIGIPSVPSVADVTNEVLIGIDFIALAS